MPDQEARLASGPLAPLVRFGRQLRARGLPVGTGRILTFCRAVGVLGLVDRGSLYWAGRATLVASRGDIETYDEAFDAWYRSLGPSDAGLTVELQLPVAPPEQAELPEGLEVTVGQTAASWRNAGEDEEPEPGDEAAIRIVASAVEVLRAKSFAELSEDERRRVARMIRDLTVRVPMERTRRTRPAPKGSTFDVRRTLRRSLRTQGEPFERAFRTRRVRSRPLVLILDISGSMAPYSRALLQFGYAAMAAGRRVEVFCFGTRLTRVTRTLRTKDPDRAMKEIARLVADWEGGTRIGESLKALLDGWSQRAALRGAVVVLCSDGLERGDPELLRAQMARMRRLAHRLIWANPLKGSPRYEPLARGMSAALPSVDVFLSGHNLESLEELVAAIGS
ncbi:MAG TPA: VWA domain-containing protein [Actinomycetota bacterium]|nr:VWA domain-containing protein [Actinomycetota bacterium]